MSADHISRRASLLGIGGGALAASAAPSNELHYASAIEIAARIRAGKISAREVLELHLKRIEQTNPKVNAIITLVADQARAAAKAADEKQARREPLGPLHGLPVAHKDLANTKGIRTTMGSPFFKDNVPTEDDLPIARMRAAGAISIGKTNTPEFGAGSQTFNTLFGPTLNPYDTTKTCGGSSGGAAVALATGMIPIADGSDMGGSLRNPAAFCNVVGFRPSIGRVPMPNAPFKWSTMSTLGPMARSVADLALLLSVQAGPHPDAPNSLPEPGSVFAKPLERSFKGVRVAWFKDLNGNPFDPKVRAVVDGHKRTFESLGCIVEEAEPDFTGADFAFKTLRAWLSAANHSERMKTQRALYKDTIVREVEEGQRLTGADIARAEMLHGQVWRRVQQFLGRYEYFILPTTQTPAFDVKLPYLTEIAGVKFDNYIDWMRSCWFISIPANPAMSIPAGFTPEGLPVGLQIVGRHNLDFSVLQMGHAFEQATRVAQRHPAL